MNKKLFNFFRPYFLILIRPLIIYLGKLKMPYTSKTHVLRHFYYIVKTIKPGDTILSISRGHFSNLLLSIVNRGFYKHSAIYIGVENEIPMVVEAISEGVVKKSLIHFLADKDEVAFIRPNPNIADSETIYLSNKWLEKQIGKPYDYNFSFNNEDFYCIELNFFYYKAGKEDIEFTRAYNSKNEINPNDFYYAKKYFTTYFEIK